MAGVNPREQCGALGVAQREHGHGCGIENRYLALVPEMLG